MKNQIMESNVATGLKRRYAAAKITGIKNLPVYVSQILNLFICLD